MKINEKIRYLREMNQLSQENMAEKLGLSVTGYAKIERGETRSNLPRLEQISEVFNMDVFELISFGEEGKVSFVHSANNLTYSCIAIGAENMDIEIQRLQLLIAHKDELLKQKQKLIDSLEREITLMKKLNEK